MESQTDLTKITDINLLKSMAYDQLVIQQQATRNIQMIEARMAELQNKERVEKK